MECREHYFMVAIDLAVTGPNPQFEAVGESLLWAPVILWDLINVIVVTRGIWGIQL